MTDIKNETAQLAAISQRMAASVQANAKAEKVRSLLSLHSRFLPSNTSASLTFSVASIHFEDIILIY